MITLKELIFLLFGGIGATLVGVYLNVKIRELQNTKYKINSKTTIITDKTNTPIVYPPITIIPSKPNKLELSQENTLSNSACKDDIPPLNIKNQIWTVLGENYAPHLNNKNVIPAPGSIKTGSLYLEHPIVKSFILDSKQEHPKQVSFVDGATAMSSEDKFLYIDDIEENIIASKFNPDKWEMVNFERTKDKLSLTLSKKK